MFLRCISYYVVTLDLIKVPQFQTLCSDTWASPSRTFFSPTRHPQDTARYPQDTARHPQDTARHSQDTARDLERRMQGYYRYSGGSGGGGGELMTAQKRWVFFSQFVQKMFSLLKHIARLSHRTGGVMMSSFYF